MKAVRNQSTQQARAIQRIPLVDKTFTENCTSLRYLPPQRDDIADLVPRNSRKRTIKSYVKNTSAHRQVEAYNKLGLKTDQAFSTWGQIEHIQVRKLSTPLLGGFTDVLGLPN